MARKSRSTYTSREDQIAEEYAKQALTWACLTIARFRPDWVLSVRDGRWDVHTDTGGTVGSGLDRAAVVSLAQEV